LARHWRRDTASDTPVVSGWVAGLGISSAAEQYPFPLGLQSHVEFTPIEEQSVLLVQEVGV